MYKQYLKVIKRPSFYLICIIVTLILLLICLFFSIQSPLFVNALGRILKDRIGYSINVKDISLSPTLKGRISGLEIKDKDLKMFFPKVSFKGRIRSPWQVVEKLSLKEPHFSYHWREEGGFDLSFLKMLPSIKVLNIKKGSLEILVNSFIGTIKLINLNISVNDFSPSKGGKAIFHSLIQVVSNNKEQMQAEGWCQGSLNFSRIYPRPIGEGNFDIYLNSGLYKSVCFKNLKMPLKIEFKGDKVNFTLVSTIDALNLRELETLKNLRLGAGFVFDLDNKIISSTLLKGKISPLCNLNGSFKAVLSKDLPWRLSFELSSVDFSNVFKVIKPILPPEYQRWAFYGKGEAKGHLEGNCTQGRPTFEGDLALHFCRGGFSSPQGTKAAEGIEGNIIIKLKFPPNKDINFHLSSELNGGEYLWCTYYKDLTEKTIRLTSKGDLRDNYQKIRFNGLVDIFKIGKCNFSGLIQPNQYNLLFEVKDISDIIAFFLEKELELTGNSHLKLKISGDKKQMNIEGKIELKDTDLIMSQRHFYLRGIKLMLPFDFFYPPHSSKRSIRNRVGILDIETIKKGDIEIKGLHTRLVLSQNKLYLLDNINLNLFGGKIRLSGLKGEYLLSPDRYFDFSIKIEDINIGLLPYIKGMFLGYLKADFPKIRYQNKRLITKGRFLINIFGGQVEVTNFFVEDPLSNSRKIGCDIYFDNINLEMLTNNIKIGKMTGIIRGSIKKLEIEYGQPSRFILDIESVKRKGIKQVISVDAIKNLSLLGTGSTGIMAVLRSGLNRFFSEYPYSCIGFSCILQNDKFSIRGKIHHGGVEYLIRRSFLRGIDVVNQNPDNEISFKDMQERIKRILRD